jgi:hypothetical protein
MRQAGTGMCGVGWYGWHGPIWFVRAGMGGMGWQQRYELATTALNSIRMARAQSGITQSPPRSCRAPIQ